MDFHKPRTYGKRSSVKRKKATATYPTEETAFSKPTVAKRQKVSPQTTTRSTTPVLTDVVSDAEDDFPSSIGIQKPKTAHTSVYQSVKANASLLSSQIPAKGAKLARDLSGILDGIGPVANPASPTKLAKRMLARSKTDTSVGSQSPTRETTTFGRTPSLPTIPPSPSKTREPLASTSKLAGSVLPPLPSSSKPATRTYAGQFRSYLAPMPPPNSQTINEDEEYETRESYSSLRTRWEIDNSEDDPYPYASPSPSKSKSNSATPDMSPFRSGKGKSKSFAGVRPLPIPYGMSNPLKSISELRNKGESRRFLDEVGYLFEGLDKQGGMGLRRASALEITTKLCDIDFARKAKAADFYTRTWDLLLDAGAAKGEDKILDILLVFFVALVARDPTSLVELTQRLPSPPPSPSFSSKKKQITKEKELSFFDALFNILECNPLHTDPLILSTATSDSDLKKGGIKPKDRSLLSTVRKTINSKSNLFSDDTIVSTSFLIAFILHALPPSTIPSQHFPVYLNSLRVSLCPIASLSLTSSLSLQWLGTASAIPYHSIHYHLRLLDLYLLDQWNPHQEYSQTPSTEEDVVQGNYDEMAKAREDWLADDLIAFAVCIELKKASEGPDTFPARKYLDTALRILVSLTHMDKRWARKVAQGDYTMGFLMRTIYASGQELQRSQNRLSGGVKKEEKEDSAEASEDNAYDKFDSQALDTLCLALGLLTNVVQNVDEAKDALRQIQINPSCPLKKRVCGHQCTCSHRSSGIEILVRLYSQQVKIESSTASLAEDSPEALAEADASFLRGHLAVLFGLLMMGSTENESAVLSALPLSDATTRKTSISTAKRAQLARFVDQAKDFAAFYTAVSDNIGGEKESKVASDVVRFLENRRDAAM